MSFTNTSATDLDDLLDKLYTFAVTTDGSWSGIYNEDLARRQIGIESGNCHIAIGSRAADLGVAKGSETDSLLSAALSTSLTEPGNRQYWGHPGSIVTTEADVDRVLTNDLGEPTFNNVWFFSGAVADVDYVHMVIQTSAERYSHFSFGIIDPLGMTHPDVAFCCGINYEWWLTSSNNNNPAATQHDVGYFGSQGPGNTYVPSGVLPVGYPASAVFSKLSITTNHTRGSQASHHYNNGNAAGKITDLFLALDNQLTTGGTPLWLLPWLFREGDNSSHIWLGALPGVRLVNIGNEAPASDISQGSDTWTVFPLKRKGLRSELATDLVNTIEYGLAYKKNV